jgi:2-polyprenyl-6-hydroxyphenyl methylase/3-demethylubiquinone-9 3-methyltransferase
VKTFFDGRPPNAPFSDVLRGDPLSTAWRIRDRAWLRAMTSLPLTSGDRVLDVGGGNGLLVDRLHARYGVRGVVVDVAMRGLREARDDGRAAKPACADALALPFADATFAAAMSFETLEHIPEWPRAVAELVRVTRPGGRIVVTAVSARWQYTWDWLLSRAGIDVFSRADHHPEQFVDPDALACEFERTGARILERHFLNAFATLVFDEAVTVAALGADRCPRSVARGFVRAADLAVRVLDAPLTFSETPWRARRRSNSVLVVAEKRR